jgi:hypothetical protein
MAMMFFLVGVPGRGSSSQLFFCSVDLFPTELSDEFSRVGEKGNRELATHCFLVFDKRVGILSTVLCSTSVVGVGMWSECAGRSEVEFKAGPRLGCGLVALKQGQP